MRNNLGEKKVVDFLKKISKKQQVKSWEAIFRFESNRTLYPLVKKEVKVLINVNEKQIEFTGKTVEKVLRELAAFFWFSKKGGEK